jgi:hypothetical protein
MNSQLMNLLARFTLLRLLLAGGAIILLAGMLVVRPSSDDGFR